MSNKIISITVIQDFPTTFYFETYTTYSEDNDPAIFNKLKDIVLSTADDLLDNYFQIIYSN